MRSYTGITGLLIAQGLKKANIPCVVFEKEPPEGRPRDWNMSLHWSYPMLTDLLTDDLMEQFKSTQTDPSYDTPAEGVLPVCNAETGELMMVVPTKRIYRISRAKLRKLCSTRVDIRYRTGVSGILMADDGESVIVQLEDGTRFTGSALVGTEGAKSVVRKFLLGDERSAAKPIPFQTYIANSRYSAEDARLLRSIHPIYTMGIHPKGFFFWISPQDIADPEDPATWEFMLMISQSRNENAPSLPERDFIADAKQLGAQSCEPFRTAWTKLHETANIWHIPLSSWEPIQWDNRRGRVTISGDAAHTMTFHRGQGLNHAINDAWSYVTKMKEYVSGQKSLAIAITEYDDELRMRGGEEVRASLENSRMLHSWDECWNSPWFKQGYAKKQE
ncbi:putative monooxygenase [Neolentinus lepideus HHB14362 ss-1]|uniref:Putative monooxygenase n=1 Tax=Neolentinus lepideus HHB14362 ss-1 TaxID=1314782 RepID=A0A165RBC9_9AGAM|nr:putative monooxygenase [Neolentinus lepideus HHB14362 ss-1]